LDNQTDRCNKTSHSVSHGMWLLFPCFSALLMSFSVKRTLEDATSEQQAKVARTDFGYPPAPNAGDSTDYTSYYQNYGYGYDYNSYNYGYNNTNYTSDNAYDPTESTY